MAYAFSELFLQTYNLTRFFQYAQDLHPIAD